MNTGTNDFPCSYSLCLIPLPGKAPVAGYAIQTRRDDQPGSDDELQAFRLPDDAWGYHQVLQPGQTGLWALNMVNDGRWLASMRDVAGVDQRLEEIAAFQNERHSERGTLSAQRGLPSDPDLHEMLGDVRRVCVEYRRTDSGAVDVACIACQDGGYWAYHGTDSLPEWLANAADMGGAVAAFHGKYAQAGSDIACLYVVIGNP